MALGVDTEWLTRYEHRTDHPPDDAEKVTVSNGLVTRVHRQIPTDQAYGDRNAWVKDPFDNVWYLAAPVKG